MGQGDEPGWSCIDVSDAAMCRLCFRLIWWPGIAFPFAHLQPRDVMGPDENVLSFKYQKVFGEDQFMAAGVVFVPVGGEKPGKDSRDNSYVRDLSPSLMIGLMLMRE